MFHHDQVMSVTGLSTHDGRVQETARFGAFGNLKASTGSSTNRLRYTGRELDSDTQFYYYRARYYDPSIGRFISEDPLGFGAGPNFYAYVGNNPVNATDPSGEFAIVDNLVAGGVNVGIGLAITCLIGSCSDYTLGQGLLDFGIGAATNGLSTLAAIRRYKALSAGAKDLLGRQAAEREMAKRGWEIVSDEVYVRVSRYNPRVDFVARAEGELVGVEAKFGPSASLSYNQEWGYPLINEGAENVLRGSHANVATRTLEDISGQSLSRVETMAYHADGFAPGLSETLPSAVGADLGYQALTTPSAVYASSQGGSWSDGVYAK